MSDHPRGQPHPEATQLIVAEEGGVRVFWVAAPSMQSSVGLLPEQIDPSSGEFFGNFPQAFSHIGVIAAGVTLARAARGGAT